MHLLGTTGDGKGRRRGGGGGDRDGRDPLVRGSLEKGFPLLLEMLSLLQLQVAEGPDLPQGVAFGLLLYAVLEAALGRRWGPGVVWRPRIESGLPNR